MYAASFSKMSSEWNLTKLSGDLPKLYQAANNVYRADSRKRAIEWQSRNFWFAVLQAFIDNEEEVALRLFPETPPIADPQSEQRLRRVDGVLSAYMATSHTRVPILFLEAKIAEGGSADYKEVEKQAQGACEDYLNSSEAVSSVVFAMCCVGTRCRMFKYIKEEGFDWAPMWGNKKEADSSQYFDAMDPFGCMYIWRALRSMTAVLNLAFEKKAFL